jgi:formylglycine-generating enzyme required for sulfatase activity
MIDNKIKCMTLLALLPLCALVFCGCFSAPDHTNPYDPENNDTAPVVMSTRPENGGINGDVNMAITVNFNCYIEGLSVTADSFLVHDIQGNRIMGNIYSDGGTITFIPVIPLFHSHTYRVVLTCVIQGINGVCMVLPYAWNFTTAPQFIPEMVTVPANTFDMGTDKNGITVSGMPFDPRIRNTNGEDYLSFLTYKESMPVHPVTVGEFQIGRYEITFDEYDEFCDSTGRRKPEDIFGRGRRPASGVTWYDAVEYCNWLSAVRGYDPCYTIHGTEVVCDFSKDGYRLPTEAEWESAARSAGTTPGWGYSGYHDGDEYIELKDHAWCAVNSNSGTHEVGTKLPNDLGIYDMSGNVAEWCWDWYSTTYYQECLDLGAVTDPVGPAAPVSGDFRKMTRGGGYIMDIEFYAAAIRGCETEWPDTKAPQNRENTKVSAAGDLGFRVCRRECAP